MVMKNGTAMRLKELMPSTIFCATTFRGFPITTRQSVAEMPTAYAMGKRSRIIRKKLPINTRMASSFVDMWFRLLYTHFIFDRHCRDCFRICIFFIKRTDVLDDGFNLKNNHG